MPQFRTRSDAFLTIRKKYLQVIIPLVIVFLGSITIVTILKAKDGDLLLSIFPSIAMAGFMTLVFFIGLKKSKLMIESYTLSITDDRITREQLNMPLLSIPFDEVQEIGKYKNGKFIVKGKDKFNVIHIPAEMEAYEALENTLHKIRPINDSAPPANPGYYTLILLVLSVASMVTVFISMNKIVVVAGGLLYLGVSALTIINIRKNKNIETRAKRRLWITALMTALVLFIIIVKLTIL